MGCRDKFWFNQNLSRTLMTGLPAYMRETIGPRANAVHSHGTRNANRWTLPQIRCEAGRRRLCYRGVSMLNEIDIEPCTLRCVTRGTLILEQDWHMILLCPTNIETIWYHSFFSTLNLQPAPSKRVFAYLLTLGH